MTTDAIHDRRAAKRGLFASAIAWVWPRPLATERRRRGLAGLTLLAWLWPSRIGDEHLGRRKGLMPLLFGWLWPQGIDRGAARWWRASWLWSWIWPGRVMGPDGEICPLAPWHPVMGSKLGDGRAARRGLLLAMLATAALAPSFLQHDGLFNGGRLNLFRSGAAEQGGGSAGGASTTGQGGGYALGGSVGGQLSKPNVPKTAQGPGKTKGELVAGPVDPVVTLDPSVGGVEPAEPGLTFLDPVPGLGGPVLNDPTLGGGFGFGGGGGLGGGGGGGLSGGGGSVGDGGDEGEPTDPTGPGDPETPGGTPPVTDPPPGAKPPVIDPPIVIDPPSDKPAFPNPPGGNPNPGGDPDDPTTELTNPDPPGGGGPVDPPNLETAVPEPQTWAMMIVGFGLLGHAIRRRRFAASLG